MAISVVQTKTNTGTTGTTLNVTVTSTTAGHSLIVAVGEYQSGGSPGEVLSISAGTASFSSITGNQDLSGKVVAEIWAADNIPSGITTVSITFLSANTDTTATVYEVSGLNPAGSADKVNVNDNDSATSPISWTSGTTATLTSSSEIAIGMTSQAAAITTITGPSSPWTNTALTSGSLKTMAGQNIVSATTGLAYAGTSTHSGTADTATVIATFAAISNVSVALPVAQVTAAAPAPSAGAGPLALSVAQVNVSAPAVTPEIDIVIALPVAQVNVSALPPFPQMSGVSLPVAQVNVAAPAVTPVIGVVVNLTTAQVNVAAPAPALGGSAVALPVAQVTAAAPAPGLSIGKNVPLSVSAVTVTARPPTPSVNISLALPVAQVSVSAHGPALSRQLLIALASAAGTDDYGNDFPQGILATAGVIEGPTLIGSDAFFYSPSPGFGNLTQSITEADGTDQYGNAWIAGTATYTDNGSFWSAVVVAGGVVTWYMATGPGGPWTSEAGIGFSWNNITGGGLNFTGPAGNDMTGDLNVSGSITVTTSLVVAGTDVGSALNAIQSALSGASTSNNGIANGQITGTSGGASAGTAHTHGGGSYSVTDGHHSHTLPTF